MSLGSEPDRRAPRTRFAQRHGNPLRSDRHGPRATQGAVRTGPSPPRPASCSRTGPAGHRALVSLRAAQTVVRDRNGATTRSAAATATSSSTANRSRSGRPKPSAAGAPRPSAPRRAPSTSARCPPAWPRGAASTSRASTTPSWSRRCGATTCATSGVVVERLDGMDDLADVVRDFDPAPVAGSACCSTTSSTGTKETRAAERPPPARARHRHAVRRRLGRRCAVGRRHRRLADVPRGVPWKDGRARRPRLSRRPRRVLAAAAGPRADLRRPRPALVGAVEQLIDFVAPPER